MTQTKKQELTPSVNTDLNVFGDNAGEIANYAIDAGMGNEHVTLNDLATPRIVLLQSGSKVVSNGVIGARAGIFHNTVTDEFFEETYFIPLDYRKEYSVFKKREIGGGGFEGSHTSAQEAGATIETLDGDASHYEIVETGRHIFLLLDENAAPSAPVIMHFAATALHVSDRFNSTVQLTYKDDAPRFAGVWKLATDKRTNSKGTWHVPSFEFQGYCPTSLYESAKKMYMQVIGNSDQTQAA